MVPGWTVLTVVPPPAYPASYPRDNVRLHDTRPGTLPRSRAVSGAEVTHNDHPLHGPACGADSGPTNPRGLGGGEAPGQGQALNHRAGPASAAKDALGLTVLLVKPHEVGQALDAHFPHHTGPLQLDGLLTGAEFSGDLAVEHPR